MAEYRKAKNTDYSTEVQYNGSYYNIPGQGSAIEKKKRLSKKLLIDRSASLTIPSNYIYNYNYNCIYNYKHNSSHSVNCIPLRRAHKKDAG